MGTITEQQYKALNAELTNHIRKLRVELAEKERLAVSLQTELLEVRESFVLEMQLQKKKLKCAVTDLLQNLDLGDDFTAGRSQRLQEQSKSYSDHQQSHRRSSTAEICDEMRRFSNISRSSRTSSPTSRRRETIRFSSSSYCSDAIVEEPTDVETEGNTDVEDAIGLCSTPSTEKAQRLNINSVITPPQRPIGELASSPDVTDTETLSETQQIAEKLRDFPWHEPVSIPSSSDESYDSDRSPPTEAQLAHFKKVIAYIVENFPLHAENKQKRRSLATQCHNNESSQELSMQRPRQALSPNLTPMRLSFAASTSTPCCSAASEKQEEMLSVPRTRRRTQLAKELSPHAALSGEEDTSSASCSTSGRPSRKCRPTSLKEPKLNTKMRNNSQSK